LCPYCYIEKRRIEDALEQFEPECRRNGESFQLDFVASEDDDMVGTLATKYQKKKQRMGPGNDG
jgi:protein disulfide-isomerase